MSDVIVVRANGTLDVGLKCDEPSMTKQSEADACDINKIMAKYERSGLLMHVNENAGFYADVTSVPDYQAAVEIVRKSDEMFMSLPGELRAKFNNDPGEYLKFCSDPANKELMKDMGMLNTVPVNPSLADQVVEALKTAGVAVAAPKV